MRPKAVQGVVNGNTARQGAAESGTTAAPATSSTQTGTSAARVTSATSHKAKTGTAASSKAGHGSSARTSSHAKHATKPSTPTTANARLRVVQQALDSHRVLALLFYNPAGSDDNAVRRELAGIPTHHGQVVKLIVPIGELPNYTALVSQVPVNYSPTLVIINRHDQAAEIAGFADSYEIAQQIDAAL